MPEEIRTCVTSWSTLGGLTDARVLACNKELASGPDGWRSNLRGAEGEAACEETVPHGSQDEMKRKGRINASCVGDT
jgi:hypothetical protein